MHKIVVSINNKKNEKFLITLLKKFDFIESVEHEEKPEIPKSKFNSWEEFTEICGIWADRDLTKESLREKAWRKRQW